MSVGSPATGARVESWWPGATALERLRPRLRWEVLLSLIVLTVLWVPLDRYTLGGALPVHLEPYRLLVAVIAVAWCLSLLADPSLRWRRIGLFGPLLALVLAVLASNAVNTARIEQYDVLPEVVKSVSLLASWILVLLLVASVITRREQLEMLVKVLVGGAAVVGFFTVVQYRTGMNVFDHLGSIPFVEALPNDIAEELDLRGEGARAYASAEHPIALSAALAVILPIGIYAAHRFEGRIWWLATAMIAVGALTTIARTGATMLLTILIVLIALKPWDMLRLWKWAIPFLVVVYMLAPGALGGLKSAFFPEGGIIAEQETAYSEGSSNRLADVGPGLEEWWKRPFLGYGYGTRISDPQSPKANARILDDQWLKLLLDVGLAGTLAVLWLFVRSYRRLARAARRDPGPHGWLLAAIAASIAAFAVGMLTFDAFAFGQATFLLFVIIGLSIPALRLTKPPEDELPA